MGRTSGGHPTEVPGLSACLQNAAVILYKPLLSHADGDWNTRAGLGAETATAHDLGGSYRPLSADGSVGTPITRIPLRNGEGAILVKGER